MKLTAIREQLPTTPASDAGHAAALAALAELAEVRALLRTPSELLASPRMRRRYADAVAWVKQYENTNNQKDVA